MRRRNCSHHNLQAKRSYLNPMAKEKLNSSKNKLNKKLIFLSTLFFPIQKTKLRDALMPSKYLPLKTSKLNHIISN